MDNNDQINTEAPQSQWWERDGALGRYSEKFARAIAPRALPSLKCPQVEQRRAQARALGVDKPIKPDLPDDVLFRKIRSGELPRDIHRAPYAVPSKGEPK